LTKATYPNNALKLVTAGAGGKRAQHVLALESGAFDIELQYQVPVTKKEAETGFVLPAQFGLVNQLTLTLVNLDVDVGLAAGRFHRTKGVWQGHHGDALLAPANDIWIALEAAQPRCRARKRRSFTRS
jgi:hypothetical protein